jgi:ergothioneine biosynthesis protein EgtB
LQFMESGGYRSFKFWLSEGWDWVKSNGVHAPLYWHQIEGDWWRYTLAGLQKVNIQEPVCHISYYEADAFARWSGKRLPTEAEWEVCSKERPWGALWEWTGSAYLPYPYFKLAEGAIGEYNGKFMVNQMVLRGSSIATPLGHSRPSYRNFFHAPLRWQFTGLRLANYL